MCDRFALHLKTRWLSAVLGLLAVAWLSGCASYSDYVREAQQAMAVGQVTQAVDLVNERLEVDRALDLPADLGKNQVLLLLERATLLQAMGEYELAARDMGIVDQRMEWLDIGTSDAVALAKFVYSDDAGGYRAPAYERLMLNALNLVNYLAMGELEGARVEARRFHLMESYFLDENERAVLPGILGFGNYLSGAAFEASREYENAARFYGRAWMYGMRSADLRERLIDLFRVTGYNANDLPQRSRVESLLALAKSQPAMRPAEYREKHQQGDTLVLVQTGMVPYRRANRVPIAQALVYSSAVYGSSHYYYLSDQDRMHATSLAARGLLTWINFPELTVEGIPHGGNSQVRIDGRLLAPALRTHVSEQIVKAWAEKVPVLMAAAISRMVVRILAGEASSAVASAGSKAAGGSSNTQAVVGLLAGVLVEGAMVAADTPDTRSWTMLPAHITISRVKLSSGVHTVDVQVHGYRDQQSVRIDETRLNVLNFSRLR